MSFFSKIKSLFFNDEKLAKDTPGYSLLIFTPALIISQILVIPFIIISLPSLLFSQIFQKKFMKSMLFVQHSIAGGALYSIQEYFFSTLEIHDVIIGSLFAFIAFYKSIKALVQETLDKLY